MVILPHFFLLFYPFEVDCHLANQSVVVLNPRNIQRDDGKIFMWQITVFQCSSVLVRSVGFQNYSCFGAANHATELRLKAKLLISQILVEMFAVVRTWPLVSGETTWIFCAVTLLVSVRKGLI